MVSEREGVLFEEEIEQRFSSPPSERRGNGNLNVLVAMAGLTLAFLGQFAGTIWWGATLAEKVTTIKETLQRMDSEKYTRADAARDVQRLDEQAKELRDRVRRLEDRVDTQRGQNASR